MSSRAIKPKRETGAPRPTWQTIEERAPSVLREQGPAFARIVAVLGLMLITVGAAALGFSASGRAYLISPGLGFFFLALGLTALLYHSFNEKDQQFRRLYGAFGFLLFVAATLLRLAPIRGRVGDAFLPYGALSLLLSLGFLMSFVKNETEPLLRAKVLSLLGLIALANGLAGLIGGMVSQSFLLQTGVIHLVLGLLFAAGYVGMEGIATTRGFWAGRAIGILGLTMFVVALVRSLMPWFYATFNWAGRPSSFFLPSGLIFMYLGAEYLFLYLGICSDNKLVVLTRRELGSFFCSPIIYIVLIGMSVVGLANFFMWAQQIFEMSSMPASMGMPGMEDATGMPEPIFLHYVATFMAIIPLIFIVPIITMRTLSEEKRSGTLEVTLTAPVNEWQVVIAKFLACLRVFMFCYYLWAVFFVALRIEGGQEFDYRPIITFFIALFCMGAGFVAMGIFFSSLTRHQIMAAVLTFVMMMVLTLLYLVSRFVRDTQWLDTVLNYVSYIGLWVSSASGTITPRLLVMHLSAAVFWLFLSIKVLEARKWS